LEQQWYDPDQWSDSGRFPPVTQPRKPRLIKVDAYTKLNNVYFAKNMFVMNCWRQTESKPNPAHMLMGFGKLFVASSGYYHSSSGAATIQQEAFDMLLYHQCALPTWPWAEMVDKLINDYAIKTGTVAAVNSSTMDDARIFVPFDAKNRWLDKNDIVICGETVVQEPFSIAKYFGENNGGVVATWQNWIETQLNLTKPSWSGSNSLNDSSIKSCARNLRFAIWRRTEGTALRLLTNEDEIRRLVGEYSDHPLSIVGATSHTPPEDQVSLFRSFDVLITPHGSHLANMVFGTNRTVFIEVAAVQYDNAPATNGAAFAGEWILSFGHLPHNNTMLTEKMDGCKDNRDKSPEGPCPQTLRLQFIQSNLIVNTTILRGDLERAITVLCPSNR